MEFDKYRISIHAMYYKIAVEHASAFAEQNAAFDALSNGPCDGGELHSVQACMEKHHEQRAQSAVVAITFSGMALEAFFYDYAAEALGDTYVKAHLDKLDLKSKYLVYPKLVCGTAPDKAGSTYQAVEKLVKLRNDLVHFKSKSFPIVELHKASSFYADLNDRLTLGGTESVDCVMLVMRELDSLHDGREFFEQRMKWSIQ